MNSVETKRAIQAALSGFANQPLAAAATALFDSLGYRSMEPGDEVALELLLGWIERFESFLNQNSRELPLSVADTSAPGFMSHLSNKRNPPPPRPRR